MKNKHAVSPDKTKPSDSASLFSFLKQVAADPWLVTFGGMMLVLGIVTMSWIRYH